MSVPRDPPLREGMVVGGCRVLARVGEGGMGVVFRGRDVALDRPVAIKVMHPARDDEAARRRFQQEAAATARLDHPGIVRIYSFGEHEGWPFFVLEFVGGPSLAAFLGRVRAIYRSGHDRDELLASGYLRHDGRRPYFLTDPLVCPLDDPRYPDHLRRLAIDLAEALAAAHASGIVHRDVKPSNILLAETGRPKLVDFGLVKRVDADSTGGGGHGFLGTLRYAAPEQVGGGGAVSPRSDVFSLGLVLFELATLVHPFAGDGDDDMRSLVGRLLAPFDRAVQWLSRGYQSLLAW